MEFTGKEFSDESLDKLLDELGGARGVFEGDEEEELETGGELEGMEEFETGEEETPEEKEEEGEEKTGGEKEGEEIKLKFDLATLLGEKKDEKKDEIAELKAGFAELKGLIQGLVVGKKPEEPVAKPVETKDEPLTKAGLKAELNKVKAEDLEAEKAYKLDYLKTIRDLPGDYTAEEKNVIFNVMTQFDEFDQKVTGNPKLDAILNFRAAEAALYRAKFNKTQQKKVVLQGDGKGDGNLDHETVVKPKVKKQVKYDAEATKYLAFLKRKGSKIV